MTKQLSLAARTVLDAAYEVRPWMVRADSGDIAAAALRAAADQVVPKFWHENNDIYGETIQDVRDQLLAIAAELEGAQ